MLAERVSLASALGPAPDQILSASVAAERRIDETADVGRNTLHTGLANRVGAEGDERCAHGGIARSSNHETNCWPPSMSYVAPVIAVLLIR